MDASTAEVLAGYLSEVLFDRAELDRYETAGSLVTSGAVVDFRVADGLIAAEVLDAGQVFVVSIQVPPWAHGARGNPWVSAAPTCECADDLDWCAHATALGLASASRLATEPTDMGRLLGGSAPGGRTWISEAFEGVLPEDRPRLYKTLAFCLHPDRRGGDATMMQALDTEYAEFAVT